jgi:predicted nucleic acid-binding protein
MARVVLDASVILALFDPDDVLHSSAADAVRRYRASEAEFAVPASVLAEILVGAARRSSDELGTRRRQTTAAFGEPVPIDEAVAVAAAKLRADHRSLRLPDALVLAVAEVTNADTVLTGDKKWSTVDPRVELVTPA